MRRIELLPGNPVPMFAAWMIMIGMALSLGGVLYFMVTHMMVTTGGEEAPEPPILPTFIGVLLIIIGIWTIVDMGRQQKMEEE